MMQEWGPAPVTLRPRTYTLVAAAVRMGVKERTIRQWAADGRLHPVPGSLAALGHHLYAEPDLVAAERANAAGRTRRSAARSLLHAG